MSRRAGGRPRDPELSGHIKAIATEILAERGPFTGDEIARRAGAGKAALYRRWPSVDDLLVEVVTDLGVRSIDYGPGPGTARGDLIALLHCATTGPSARAEAAVLSRVGGDERLRKAYGVGPFTYIVMAAVFAGQRAEARHEPPWPALEPVLAAWSLLMHQLATSGTELGPDAINDVVDRVALPALLGGTQ